MKICSRCHEPTDRFVTVGEYRLCPSCSRVVFLFLPMARDGEMATIEMKDPHEVIELSRLRFEREDWKSQEAIEIDMGDFGKTVL